jgi:D-sedoheptulose 7-phosphate isomerase
MKVTADVEQLVAERVQESIAAKQALLQDAQMLTLVADVACRIAESLQNSGTVFFFGNGGSAADAQHLAAELEGRFLLERAPLRGIALTTNTSCLTAISNDYGYESVFSRQLEAMGSAGDIAIGISTSGSSKNVLHAFDIARAKRMTTVALTGRRGRSLDSLVDYCVCVDSDRTPRIQEIHIMIGHILCEIVEEKCFGNGTHRLCST